MEATVVATTGSSLELSPEQQAAVDAATKAGGYFISYELIQSQTWLEALVRGSQYFKERSPEWIAMKYQCRYPETAGYLEDILAMIPEGLYKELEQEAFNDEVQEMLRGDRELLINYYLPRACDAVEFMFRDEDGTGDAIVTRASVEYRRGLPMARRALMRASETPTV